MKKLKLPQAVADDPNQQVIYSADLKPSPGGYTTATVLDVQTGEAVTRYTEKSRPLFALGGVTEIGARYGLSTKGGQHGTIYARQDLLRVSATVVILCAGGFLAFLILTGRNRKQRISKK